jgi:hypothetical protein
MAVMFSPLAHANPQDPVATAQNQAEKREPSATIAVGANVQVSAQNPTWHHDEVILGSDPTNPKRMVACGISITPETAQRTDVIYATADGGATWKQTFRVPEQSSDPICMFGLDGTAYFVPENVIPEGVTIYTSSDGGMTWKERRRTSLIIPGYDRHFSALDDTNGKFRGRVYIDEWSYVRQLEAFGRETSFEGMGLYYTDDSGATWSDVMRRVSNGFDVRVDMPGNCDVFSDGGLACIFLQNTPTGDHGGPGLRALRVMNTPPGGAIFMPAVTIEEKLNIFGGPHPDCPKLAIDRYTTQFKDRVYAVWSANRASQDIWSAYSTDHGQNWSKPVMVNDDHADLSAPGPGHQLPEIAVNKQGVIGIMWNDGREAPKGGADRTRFTVSLDGGETFLPSVAVATAPFTVGKGEDWPHRLGITGDSIFERDPLFHRPKPLHTLNTAIFADANHGDTSALVADSTGTFWGLWTDNRTKYDQIWTAPIHVTGTPAKHGSAALASLDDVSDKVDMYYTNISYDEAKAIASISVQLKNISSQTLHGPLNGRLLAFSSGMGTPKAINAENNLPGLGAVWQFDLNGQSLAPGELSRPRKIEFQIMNLQSFSKENGEIRGGLVSFDLQILGK